MNEQHIEDIISALYDMIQDARALPLGADKCILERDKVLDMLDEIIAQLPEELKQSRTIVESRNELIGQARREAEGIVRQAQQKAKELVAEEAIYQEARRQCQEMFNKTQTRIAELRKASNEYMMTLCVVLRRQSLCPWVRFRTLAQSSVLWPRPRKLRTPRLKKSRLNKEKTAQI